jgi:hypothetical protein
MAKQIVSPKGEAKWAFLDKPDTRFDEDGIYRIELVLEQTEQVQSFLDRLDEMANEAWEEQTKETKPTVKSKAVLAKPYQAEEDPETGEETGRIVVRFKSKAKVQTKKGLMDMKPRVFDAKGRTVNPVPKIGNGSTVKVAFAYRPYFVASSRRVGVSLYLNAVQLIELVEFGGGNPFGEEEGGFSADTFEAQTEGSGGDDGGDADVAW